MFGQMTFKIGINDIGNIFVLYFTEQTIALVLDGNLGKSSHVLREVGNLICISHLFRSTAGANLTSFTYKTFFS